MTEKLIQNYKIKQEEDGVCVYVLREKKDNDMIEAEWKRLFGTVETLVIPKREDCALLNEIKEIHKIIQQYNKERRLEKYERDVILAFLEEDIENKVNKFFGLV